MFKGIKVDKVDAQSFNRSEQNTQAAFEELDQKLQLQVIQIASSASVNSYIVKPSDLYIVVDSSGGEMKIVLPSPLGPTQAVEIKNAKGRTITVVQSDGKPMGDAAASIDIPVSGSMKMVNTGKAWYSFNG